MKQVGDVLKIKCRGTVSDIEEGKVSIDLNDIIDTTKAEEARLADKDGILSDDDLVFIFGGED